MATLSINKSREYAIFQAFSKNSTYRDVLTELEAFDKENPDKRVFPFPEDKKSMRESYRLFKEGENEVMRGGMKLDYDDNRVVERLKNILSQKVPAISRKVLKAYTDSVAFNKANIGCMMAVHARNVKVYGKRELNKSMEEPRRNQQAMVSRYRKLGHSPYDGIFSKKDTYKTIGEILQERAKSERSS